MLEDFLPKGYNYKIIKNENFACEIRTKIETKDDFRTWIKKFESLTKTSWLVRNSRTKETSNFVLSRDYVCKHSSYRKRREIQPNKQWCTATLSVRTKRNTKHTRVNDKLLKEGFVTIIKIDFMHTHKINFIQPDNWLNNCQALLQVKEEGQVYEDIYKDDDLSYFDEENDNDADENLENEVSKTLYRKNEMINNFYEHMHRILAVVELIDDSDINLDLMESFTERIASVTTAKDLNDFFSEYCETGYGKKKEEQSVPGNARKSFRKGNSIPRKVPKFEHTQSTDNKTTEAESASENSYNTPNVIYLL